METIQNKVKIIALVLMLLQGCVYAQDKAKVLAYMSKLSAFYDIPEYIMPAIGQVESGFYQKAKSEKDAYGVMQITRPCYEHYTNYHKNSVASNSDAVKKDWMVNCLVSAWYLKRVCYKVKGNWEEAISAYFWGPSSDKVTLTYYNKVEKEMVKLKKK